MLRHVVVAALAAAFVLFSAMPANAAGTVVLKVYEGYNFVSGSVTKSGAPDADVSFYVNRGRRNAYAFELGAFGAAKIKEFGTQKPAAGTFAASGSWDDSVNAPSPGYYGVVAKDGGQYLVRVLSFKNQGKSAHYWELSFTWERVR